MLNIWVICCKALALSMVLSYCAFGSNVATKWRPTWGYIYIYTYGRSLTAAAAGEALAEASSGAQLLKSIVALTCGLAIHWGQSARGGTKSGRNTSSQSGTSSESVSLASVAFDPAHKTRRHRGNSALNQPVAASHTLGLIPVMYGFNILMERRGNG